MKKFLTLGLCLVLAIVLLVGCRENKTATEDLTATLRGNVKTGGSTSVEKVMNSLIYRFQEQNEEATIDYEMNGSGDGIKNTISGLYEIGHSSRDLKTDGTEDNLDPIPYAIDGIAVVVHKDNVVDDLTKDQLKDIYTGKITNWNQIGGKDALITVITREVGSGTRAAFTEIIGLDKKNAPETNILDSATIADSTGAIQTTVSQNPNAIGYMSFSDVDTSRVQTVKYNSVSISSASLKDGSYKLKREFLLVTKKGTQLSNVAQAFLDFVLSDEGQEIVSFNKLLPVK